MSTHHVWFGHFGARIKDLSQVFVGPFSVPAVKGLRVGIWHFNEAFHSVNTTDTFICRQRIAFAKLAIDNVLYMQPLTDI